MTLELTPGQEQARQMVKALRKIEGPAFGIICGFAGTGKTTMLRVLAEEHGAPIVLTPTGKAALRVAEASGLEALTIHRWMYAPAENPETGEVRFDKKPIDTIAIPSNHLVVIDEASMVSEEMWNDIWGLCHSIGLKVLLVGDKFQLPPVYKKDGEWKSFSTLVDLKTEHRVDLTEVVRQALDSPIIRASMMIRTSERKAMEAVMSHIDTIPRHKLVETFSAMNEDSRALIAHMNVTRQQLNIDIRNALGYDENALKVGEPLLVLANSYKAERWNGEVVRFDGWTIAPGRAEAVRDRYKNTAAMMTFGLANVEGAGVMLSQEEVFAQTQGVGMPVIARFAKEHSVMTWGYERKQTPAYLNANLGHCLTCHKSQGSEWKDVLVYAERSIGGKPGLYGYEGRRWLYTAITRARQNLILCVD
jgi:exodeoxyribonuclease-5